MVSYTANEPLDEKDYKFISFVVVTMVLMIFGALGNALTLAAVTYATAKKKPMFDGGSWMATTVFIFNLSIVELLYCLFMLTYMIYGIVLWFNVDVGSTSGMCKFFLLGIQDIGLIDGWSIALIAFTRALPNIK